ncbi:MAG: hypothetical protein Q4E99_03725 [Bacillota bacterium]|nr:hypothetical protein [Bacillota bacterium]
MLKALLNKNMQELLQRFSITRTSGKKGKTVQARSKAGTIGMIVLWVFIFLSVGAAFMGMSVLMGDTLLPLGLDWLYFAIMGLIGLVIIIFLNGFMANAVLFTAKDNELLLSMPIPPMYILISRTAEIYILSFIYLAAIFIPMYLERSLILQHFSIVDVVLCIVMLILVSLTATAISAILGWIFAYIGKRVKNKSVFTVIITIVLMSAYYYINFNSQKYLTMLAENSLGIGEKIESSIFGYPLYQMGMAAAGNPRSLIICAVLSIAFFAIVYYVLNKTFIKVATTSEKHANVKYDAAKQKEVVMISPRKALFKKEVARFVGSPTYMLNCGLGLLLFVAAAVMLVIKGSYLNELIDTLLPLLNAKLAESIRTDLLPLGIFLASILFISMCDIAAPSISLEGQNLWILKSMPAKTSDIFLAKENLQVFITIPVLTLFNIVAILVFKIDWTTAIIMWAASVVYLRMNSVLLVMLDLKNPKLEWVNEAVPIKQSFQVVIAIFGSWVLAVGIGALYYFVLKDVITGENYMLVLMVLFVLATRVADKWLSTKGSEIFAAL